MVTIIRNSLGVFAILQVVFSLLSPDRNYSVNLKNKLTELPH